MNKSSPAQSPSVLVKNCVSESHEGPQELQLDNESVSNELLILASQKYEDDRGCYLEENDETDEILLLASQQFEEQYSSDERCLEILIYDMDHQEVQSKLVMQEGLVFLKKHKGKISGLQRCGVIGYNTDCRCHALRKKNNSTH